MSRRNESMIKARSNPKSGEPPFFSFPASLFILLFIKVRCHGTTSFLFCGGAHFFAQFLQAFASTTYLAQNPIGIGFSSLQPINFPFFLPIFFYNWTDQQSPKDQQPPDQISTASLPGYYFPTSFSSRGLQGPHHHHLYHHHHDPTRRTRRDGPSDQPTRYHHHQSLQDELRTAPSRELKTSTALPPSIKTRLEYLSAPNPSAAAFLPRGGVDSFTHPKLKGTDSSGKSSATEINRPGTILIRVVSRKNQRTDHRRTAIDPPCKYS